MRHIQQNRVDIEHSKNHQDRSEISMVLSNRLVDRLDMDTDFCLKKIDFKAIRNFTKKNVVDKE